MPLAELVKDSAIANADTISVTQCAVALLVDCCIFLTLLFAVNFATWYKCFWLPTAVDVTVAAATSLLLFQFASYCHFAVEVAVAACCTATAVGLQYCAIASALVLLITIAAGWLFLKYFYLLLCRQ